MPKLQTSWASAMREQLYWNLCHAMLEPGGLLPTHPQSCCRTLSTESWEIAAGWGNGKLSERLTAACCPPLVNLSPRGSCQHGWIIDLWESWTLWRHTCTTSACEWCSWCWAFPWSPNCSSKSVCQNSNDSVCWFDCVIWFCATFNRTYAILVCWPFIISFIYSRCLFTIHSYGLYFQNTHFNWFSIGSKWINSQNTPLKHSIQSIAQFSKPQFFFVYSMYVIILITGLSYNWFHHPDRKSGAADPVACSADCQDWWTWGNKVVSLMHYQ